MNFSESFKQSGHLCKFSPDGKHIVSSFLIVVSIVSYADYGSYSHEIFNKIVSNQLMIENKGIQMSCTLSAEVVMAPCCNPLTLQPEQSGGQGSNLTTTFERHDEGSWT